MTELTQRQQQILQFILKKQQVDGETPSLREIASHFGFSSMNAALAHVQALCRKGVLEKSRRARSLRLVSPWQRLRNQVVDIPIFGSIPAGFSRDRQQEARGCLSIDVQTLGIRPTSQAFALEVRGDSMIGKHILDGDFVILEHGRTPRNGDVVAALIDGDSTLKTFCVERGKPSLRAENPKYPKFIPTSELVIQGVMIGLVRATRQTGSAK